MCLNAYQVSYMYDLTISQEPERQHSKNGMCCLRNIAKCDYQESVTTGQTDRQTGRHTEGQTLDKVIPNILSKWMSELVV